MNLDYITDNFIINFDGTKILVKGEINAKNLFNALISSKAVDYNYKYDDPKYTIKKDWKLEIIRVETNQIIDFKDLPTEPEFVSGAD